MSFRSTLLLAGAAMAILAAGTGVATARPSSAGAAANGARVYVAAEGCRGHVYRPRKRVILACADANLYVTGIRWRSYGSREARGTGAFHLNDCRPDCAGGHFHVHSGSIRLFDVVQCADGRRYFARARYSFAGAGGKGAADIEPVLHCRGS